MAAAFEQLAGRTTMTTGRSAAALADRGRRRIGAHAREADRGAPADRPDGRGVHRQRGAAGPRPARGRRTGRWRATLIKRCGELGLLGTDVPEALGGVALDKVASLVVGEAVGPLRVVGDDLRRADRPGDHAAPLLRHRRQKQKYLPGAGVGRVDRRLRAERVGLGLRRARRQGPRDAAARRQLPADRREDVDHQRRLRRPVHRLRQGRRRGSSPRSSSSARSRASASARKSTRWACTARRRRR